MGWSRPRDTASWLATRGPLIWLAWGVSLLASGNVDSAFSFIEWLALAGPLAVVPWGLELVGGQSVWSGHDGLVRTRRWLPWGAGAAVLSVAFEPGWLAAVCSVGWLLVTWRIGRLGLRGARSSADDAAAGSEAIAFLYLFMGGVMWAAARAELQPLGVREPLVTLAAVHFHFAAFGTLLLAAHLQRTVVAARERVLLWPMVWLLRVAPLGVAVGIIWLPLLERVSAVALACGGALLAAGLLWRSPGSVSTHVSVLRGVSGLSGVVGMVLAAAHGVGPQLVTGWPGFARMVWWHGPLNAVGFIGCGLLAALWEEGSALTSTGEYASAGAERTR